MLKKAHKNDRKELHVVIKVTVLNVVRCLVKEEDVLEYARLFSVIIGKEKEL